MKYFVVDIKYKVPFDKISEIVESHRAYLSKGYDSGLLLLSGPKESKTGGLVIAKSKTKDELIDFFKNDPYFLNDFAEYSFIEFLPVKYQKILSHWIQEEL